MAKSREGKGEAQLIRPESRKFYRRHEKDCPHRNEGQKYETCRCSIWLDYRHAGNRICMSLGTRNWKEAEDSQRKWGSNAGKQVRRVVRLSPRDDHKTRG